VLPRRHSRLERIRATLDDGCRTTLHVASYDLAAFVPRVVALDEPMPLVRWCRQQGVRHAVVGGFFIRAEYVALGELQIAGQRQPTVPFDDPWQSVRACLQVSGAGMRIARRDQLHPELDGDLLQAGPLLAAGGYRTINDGEDLEGFSAGARQFDSDITKGRYPRAAIGLAGDRLIAVACDGRTRRDAGMTLAELADAMLNLGAIDALNLDGGGSASLVHDGRLRNRPREQHGIDLLEGRPIVSAIVFQAR
jgi:hypothetical protein